VPVTIGLCFAADSVGLRNDPARFLVNLTWINGFLLLFNILPIYPLDGGQMLQAVLWFVVGRAWSLLIVGCLGLAIGLGIVGVSVWADQWLLALIAVAFVVRSVSAFQFGRNIGRMADVPRREKFACPSCRLPPPVGEFWTCNKCKTPFDIFENPAICPACESQSTCGTEFAAAQCVMCQAQHPLLDWLLARAVDAPLIEKAIDRANPYASFGDVADRVAT
jgi:hypothetical protein